MKDRIIDTLRFTLRALEHPEEMPLAEALSHAAANLRDAAALVGVAQSAGCSVPTAAFMNAGEAGWRDHILNAYVNAEAAARRRGLDPAAAAAEALAEASAAGGGIQLTREEMEAAIMQRAYHIAALLSPWAVKLLKQCADKMPNAGPVWILEFGLEQFAEGVLGLHVDKTGRK